MIQKLMIILFMMLVYSNQCIAETNIVSNLSDAVALSEDTQMPLLLVFGADWCQHCNNLKRDLNSPEFAGSLDNYIICYINIDKNPDLKKEYRVRTLPDSRIIRNKIEQSIIVGYERNKYKKWITHANK